METRPTRLATTLTVLTLPRLMLNGVRRFPYVILTPMAVALGVPRSTLEVALSIQWAVGMISPFSGLFIDRVGRKQMMLIGIGVLAVFSILAALGQSPVLIIFALIAGGLSKVFYDPAMQAYIGDRVPYKQRGMAIGVTELSWSGSLFLMGSLAAFLIAQVTLNAIFAVVALGCILSFVLIAAILPADQSRHTPGEPFYAKLNVLRANRSALAMLLISILMSLAIESMSIVYEAWLRDAFLLTTIVLGTLSWLFSAAEVTGEGFVIGVADRWGKRRLSIAALVLTGILYFMIPRMPSEPLAVGALFLMFLVFEVSIVVLIPLITEILPEARGTMMSTNMAAQAGGRAVGTLLGGWMFRTGGYAMNGTVALIINLIAAALLWRFVVERHEHTVPQPVTSSENP